KRRFQQVPGRRRLLVGQQAEPGSSQPGRKGQPRSARPGDSRPRAGISLRAWHGQQRWRHERERQEVAEGIRPSKIAAGDDFAPRVRGQSAKDVGRNAVADEAGAAVAEEEVAAVWMEAAEAADVIAAALVVSRGIVAGDGRRARSAIHRLVTRVGANAVLSR